MYQYIYDNFLVERRYAKTIAEMENRLTDLGIQGRVDRLHPFKSLREAVEEGRRRGVRTVVAVGSDETFRKIVEVAAGKDVVLGYIPLAAPDELAALLGIPAGLAACDILCARLTETLDLGRVNGQYFLSAVSFGGSRVTLECEGRYRVALVHGGRVSVCNIASFERDGQEHRANPCDGFLDAVLEPEVPGQFFRSRPAPSVLALRRLVARAAEPFTLQADGRELRGQTAEIDVAKEKLRVVVGKERVFAQAT